MHLTILTIGFFLLLLISLRVFFVLLHCNSQPVQSIRVSPLGPCVSESYQCSSKSGKLNPCPVPCLNPLDKADDIAQTRKSVHTQTPSLEQSTDVELAHRARVDNQEGFEEVLPDISPDRFFTHMHNPRNSANANFMHDGLALLTLPTPIVSSDR